MLAKKILPLVIAGILILSLLVFTGWIGEEEEMEIIDLEEEDQLSIEVMLRNNEDVDLMVGKWEFSVITEQGNEITAVDIDIEGTHEEEVILEPDEELVLLVMFDIGNARADTLKFQEYFVGEEEYMLFEGDVRTCEIPDY